MRGAWESGLKVTKCIGFDATEDHRVGGGGTYADAKGLSIAPAPGVPNYAQRYDIRYPLRDLGYDRVACREIIYRAGLPIPPKSACFFCPAMRQIEIARLRVLDPDLHALAVRMEQLYRDGKHFRGDNVFTVKAQHRSTQEKVEFEAQGQSVAEVRQRFRVAYSDTVRPHRYKVQVYPAVVGLSRSSSWGNFSPKLVPVQPIRKKIDAAEWLLNYK